MLVALCFPTGHRKSAASNARLTTSAKCTPPNEVRCLSATSPESSTSCLLIVASAVGSTHKFDSWFVRSHLCFLSFFLRPVGVVRVEESTAEMIDTGLTFNLKLFPSHFPNKYELSLKLLLEEWARCKKAIAENERLARLGTVVADGNGGTVVVVTASGGGEGAGGAGDSATD